MTAGVVQTTGPITWGTPADEAVAAGLLVVTEPEAADLPAFPVGSPAELTGMVAAVDIPAGAVVASGMFVATEAPGAGLVRQLRSPGLVAVAVTIDATRAVGGWLRPGDRVNILVPSVCPDESALVSSAANTGNDWRCRRMRHLFQAVEVMAVGPATTTAPGVGVPDDASGLPQQGAATVVLAVPPRAAQWITTYDNDLWFTLVAPDYQARPVLPLPAEFRLLPGEDPLQLTPYCPDPAAPPPDSERPPGCPPSGMEP